MPTLYLESTVPSYLAARPSRDLIVAAHQQSTWEWWETSRRSFDLFVSQAVLEEIGAGDSDAAARRLALVQDLPSLALTENVERLARTYVRGLSLPPRASIDVVHLAFAVAYEMDYLLTWNCVHLANGMVIRRLHELNAELERRTPVIVTPDELMVSPEEE